MHSHRSILLILPVLMALSGFAGACKAQPQCTVFTIDSGSRRGLSSFDHPNDTAVWSNCSDGKTRALRCTTAHLSNWKCVCILDNQEKTRTRTDSRFPDEQASATAFANRTCDWQLR